MLTQAFLSTEPSLWFAISLLLGSTNEAQMYNF